MSKLYATIDSDSRKTQATSRGHKRIITHTATWNGAIRVEIKECADGKLRYCVERVAWHGTGNDKATVLSEGEM